MNYLGILIFFFLLVIALTGCATPHMQFRTDANKTTLGSFEKVKDLSDNDFKETVGERIVENYKEFSLNTIEFDDQGKFWDRKHQLESLYELTKDPIAKQNGAIIIVFVHGWQENADVLSPTVSCFRNLLYHLSLDETARNASLPRRIIGVYVGWRGKSERLPILRDFTFWNRKETAHRIGRGDMDELLVHLEDIKKELSEKDARLPNKTRLIIVGHSFGGAIVYSAFDNILKDKTSRAIFPYQHQERQSVGLITAGKTDFVILLNPAFEALLYSGLADITEGFTHFNDRQTPVLITIGAENDSATKKVFPIGNFFPALWQKFKPNSDEREQFMTTLGNYKPYINFRLNHALGMRSSARALTAVQRKRIKFIQTSRKDKVFPARSPENKQFVSLLMSHTPSNTLWRLEPHYFSNDRRHLLSLDLNSLNNLPFLVIAADKEIVNGHTGIWGDALVDFLRDFIDTEDRAKTEADIFELSQKNDKK